MNCEAFREAIAADPGRLDEPCAEHASRCPACRAHAERLGNAEWLIHEALRFDVAALKRGAEQGSTGAKRSIISRRAWAGVAAVAVGAMAIWIGVGQGPEPSGDPLVADILEHWSHEPRSWVETDVQISPASLARVVSGEAAVDANRLGLVSYARSCYVGGRWVPHLVVQGAEGPVMVLLLRHEPLDEPLPLDMPDEGLRGTIIPLGEGSVAVLGADAEPLGPLRQRVMGAVEWSI